ncbi:MAG: hypothetical protein ABIC40_07775, partial [bacterium]
MRRHLSPIILGMMALIMLVGCHSGGSSPVLPSTSQTLTQGQSVTNPAKQGINETDQKALWGLWYISYDPESKILDITKCRTSEFRANVTQFINGGPNLKVAILDDSTLMTDGKIQVEVGLVHPFPGLYEYSGFDVWGIFLHNGSGALDYGSGLPVPESGTDAILWNADGYTRWWNQLDFTAKGVLGFTAGKLASLKTPTAKINAYKSFADGLGATDDYATFLKQPDTTTNRGIFMAGNTNYRNYDLQFPMVGSVPVVKFAYAVAASWEEPVKKPGSFDIEAGGDTYTFFDSAVAEEAICLSVIDKSNLFYSGTGGGSISFDLEIFDWGALSTTMADEIGFMQIESPLLSGPLTYDQSGLAGMAQDGTNFSSVYSFDLVNDPPTSGDPVEVWLIVEQTEGTYENAYGVPAPSDPLASYFRMWVPVSPEPMNPPTLVSGVDGDQPPCNNSVVDYNVVASGDITGYKWSVVPTGNSKNFNITDDDILTFDWGTVTEDADYDVDCRIYNGAAFVEATTLVASVPANNPPVVDSGVNGPGSCSVSQIATYSIAASDSQATSATIHEDDFSTNLGWTFVGISGITYWGVTGGVLTSSTSGIYGWNSYAQYEGISIPSDATTMYLSYGSSLAINEDGCSYDIAQILVSVDGGPFNLANAIGTYDQPPMDCTSGWGSDYAQQNTLWTFPAPAGSTVAIRYYIWTYDNTLQTGAWVIDDFDLYYYPNCAELDYMWSVVPTGNSPDYSISGGASIDIDWSTYGIGTYDVNCQVSDGTLTVEGTIKTVDVVSAHCTNGMFETNLGDGTHNLNTCKRFDIGFLYGGSYAGDCIINSNYLVSGTELSSGTDGLYRFDADTVGAKTTTALFTQSSGS